MRYANIDTFETINGEGVGISLFVQGCHFHCPGCFNSDAWNFNDGKEWTEESEKYFFELIAKSYIKRISILGGEPLADENINVVLQLIKKINKYYPDKAIWLYSGYTWDKIINKYNECKYSVFSPGANKWLLRYEAIGNVDIFVDGQFEKDKKDLTLKFRGSRNQHVIDVQESLKQNKLILYFD